MLLINSLFYLHKKEKKEHHFSEVCFIQSIVKVKHMHLSKIRRYQARNNNNNNIKISLRPTIQMQSLFNWLVDILPVLFLCHNFYTFVARLYT